MTAASRNAKFAERTAHLRASTIREILKVTQQPDVISFAGGLPAPELFPTDAIAECTREVMDEYGSAALQYSVTEGIPELREWIAAHAMANRPVIPSVGREATGVEGQPRITAFEPRDVLVVNGSQQGLDLLGKVLLDPGDHVVLERPSYLGAIQAFDSYQARYLTVETDEHGMLPESLERTLEHADPLPKLVYLIPNFQNPTGRTLALERRERIVRICEACDVPIVEDDPYGELRFEGASLPALASFPTRGTVAYLGTASKIAAPGLRVAWIVTRDRELQEKIVLAKQGADLQPGTFTQYVFHRYASRAEAFRQHVARIVRTYRARRDAMCEALRATMPAGVEFNRPEGGMFLWTRVPGVDTEALLELAGRVKVAFVPGISFYPARDVRDGMRLNFSNATEEKIALGIERLADAIRSL